jgi:hypothetical protein
MSSERATKKQKVATKKRIMLLADFHLSDCILQPFVKSAKCNLVPLVYSNEDKNSPVLVQLNGGGVIPLSFGIEDKEVDGRRKVQIAYQIDSLEDHEHLDRLRTELGELAVANWSIWFPDNTAQSKEVLMNFCGNFVSNRKKMKNSDAKWSGVCKSSLDPDEYASGKCKIVDSATGESIPFTSLPGMHWNKIIIELRYVFIQATKSYGITKKLRYMACTPVDDDDDIEPL